MTNLATGLWPESTTSAGGILHLGGTPVPELAQVFGTPSYLLDVPGLKACAARYRRAFETAFDPAPVCVYYAGKAFLSTAVARWVHSEGLRIDTASAGELATALGAGITGEHIGLHGNNKSRAEIEQALAAGVGRIVIDSLPEIDLVAQCAAEMGVTARVMIRVTTGIHAGGHDFIATAHEDQKFGLSLAGGAAMEALRRILDRPALELVGLHSHIGSQILDFDGFAAAAAALLGLRADLESATGHLAAELDLGGGYAIAHTPAESGVDIEALAPALAQACRAECARLGTTMPAFSFEPGRSIIGPSMLTVYQVGTVKEVQLPGGGARLYVSVDGGMSDNIRPALYGADYHAELASRTSTAPTMAARVVGKHCESGDIVVRDVQLPGDICAGDLLAVPATGAYGRSMASQYNLIPRPGVVAVGDGEPREIVKRESVQDLLSLDLG